MAIPCMWTFTTTRKKYFLAICLIARLLVLYKGQPLAYLNSLLQLSFALNQGDFAKTYSIASGNEWHVEAARK